MTRETPPFSRNELPRRCAMSAIPTTDELYNRPVALDDRISLEEALASSIAHKQRISPWTSDRVTRANKAKWHPVYDFLFEYYPYRPSKLERWSPGCDITVTTHDSSLLDWSEFWSPVEGGVSIVSSSFPQRRRDYLLWAHKYLANTADRPPFFGCFGLHEWAMVYRAENVRHEYVPLRLTQKEINEVVEGGELKCSHYDAFRFFTPDAVPRNRTHLTRETTTEFDQRGCIHVTMDLYKFAHKISPWSSSELIADCFVLAAKAREIDMRASPYDLTHYGFAPIRIEEKAGREEYLTYQRELSELSRPIRSQLLTLYSQLIASSVRSQ